MWARERTQRGGVALRGTEGIWTASAGSAARGARANNAFDGNEATAWWSGKTNGPVWLQYQFNGLAWPITQYKLISSTNANTNPRDWQLLGSNDGSNWTMLDGRTNETFTVPGQMKRYAFSNHTPYRYYRFNFTATMGGADSGVRFPECQLWPEGTPGLATADARNHQ